MSAKCVNGPNPTPLTALEPPPWCINGGPLYKAKRTAVGEWCPTAIQQARDCPGRCHPFYKRGEVLRSFPFDEITVAVWSIESNRHNRTELHEYMEAKGYSCTDPDHINTVCHLTKEDSE